MGDGPDRLPAEFDRLVPQSEAYAPRQVVIYLCEREHLVSVPFAVEAQAPETWNCRCGLEATLVTQDASPAGS